MEVSGEVHALDTSLE